jgi:hypothetical protein
MSSCILDEIWWLVCMVLISLSTTPAVAQDQSAWGQARQEGTENSRGGASASARNDASNNNHEARGSWLVAPLPISSPALGSGFVPVLGYIFSIRTNDKTSPPSILGVAGLATNNGSRGIVLAGELYFQGEYLSNHCSVCTRQSELRFVRLRCRQFGTQIVSQAGWSGILWGVLAPSWVEILPRLSLFQGKLAYHAKN